MPECAMRKALLPLIVSSYVRKNITRLLPLALLLMLHTHNNTDGNKVVIFFGIAMVINDTEIVSRYEF